MKISMLVTILLGLNIYASDVRGVSTAQFTTEILLTIGAEKQLVGTANLWNEIAPELKEQFEKIPELSKRSPTKEQFYELNPNFLTGWKSISTKKNLGDVEELEKNGVEVYIPKTLESNSLESLYEDILFFGKKFNVETNARALIEKLKKQVELIKNKNIYKKKLKVFGYDGKEDFPYVVGGGAIGNTLIEIAGGENIYKETSFGFGNGQWEKIIDSNPEIIVIVDYDNASSEEKIEFLKNRSPIKMLEAVKNNNFIVIPLNYISSGIHVVKGIEILSDGIDKIRNKNRE